jgi:large subunit ribosomal protein L28
LDNYVMKTRSDILGMEGMRLRILVRARLEEEARLKEEADKAQRAKEKKKRREAYYASQTKKIGAGKTSSAQPSGKKMLDSLPPL